MRVIHNAGWGVMDGAGRKLARSLPEIDRKSVV